MKKEEVNKILSEKIEDGEHISPVLPEGIKNYLIDIDGTRKNKPQTDVLIPDLAKFVGGFFVQTQQIKDDLSKQFGVPLDKMLLLPPMIPDVEDVISADFSQFFSISQYTRCFMLILSGTLSIIRLTFFTASAIDLLKQILPFPTLGIEVKSANAASAFSKVRLTFSSAFGSGSKIFTLIPASIKRAIQPAPITPDPMQATCDTLNGSVIWGIFSQALISTLPGLGLKL